MVYFLRTTLVFRFLILIGMWMKVETKVDGNKTGDLWVSYVTFSFTVDYYNPINYFLYYGNGLLSRSNFSLKFLFYCGKSI